MFEPGKRESKRQSSTTIKAGVFSVGTARDKPNITASPQRGLATVAVSLAVVGIALVGTLAISRLIVSLTQEPLRPTLSQRQAPTPHNQQVNRQAAPDTTPYTILERVALATTINNPLVAGIAHVGETFQNIYDHDSGERTIAVNDGGISFDITTKAKYLYIDLKEDGTYFKVQDNGLDVFRVDYDKNVIVHQGATLHLLGKLKDNTGSLGEAGQVLTAPGGSGSPSWENAGGLTVGGLNCNNCIDQDEIKDVYVLNTGDSIAGDLTLNGQKQLRFADSDSSNYVSFRGAATIASNVTWTLPSTDGAASTLLSTDGSGTLSWATAAAGGGSLDAAYNDSTATITVDAYDILFDLNDATNDYGLVIDNNTSGVIAIGLEFTSGGGGVLTTALEVSASLITNAINVGANTILGTTAVIDFNNFDVAGSGAITLTPSSALTTAIDVTDTDITNAISIGTNILAITTGTIGSNAATVIDFLDFDVSADGLIVLAPDSGGDAITVTPSAAITDGLDVANSIITNAINVGPNTILGTTAVIDFTNFDVSAGGTTTTKSLVANVVALPGGNILVGHTVNSNYLSVNGGLGTGGLERITSTGNLTNISAITAGHLALSTAGDSFTRGTDETAGAGTGEIATADFNADGYPDLAVVNNTDNDVSIHLNDGDGTFTRNASDEATGASPQEIATADFNGDGYPDLAVVNGGDSDVSIHLNDGDGTFTRRSPDIAVGASPRDIVTADFNADGYPDLAVVNGGDSDVSIHLNDGDGTFTKNASDETVGASPQDIVTADFNGDGYPDLAVANSGDNDVSIHLNDGDGTFTRNGADEAVGAGPQDIVTADFNADGYVDLAVTNNTDDDVSIHLNDGDGTFTRNSPDQAVGAGPQKIATADFNADGYPDLAVANGIDNDVSIHLNDRDGTFTRNASDETVGASPLSITTADFDQDGYPDLATANLSDNDVSILINDTQTTFTGRLLDVASNSSNTSQRTLIQITNDNTGATGTTALTIQQDGGGTAILVTGASILHALDASENNITNAINVGANTIVGTTAVIDFTDFDVSNIGSITAQNSSAVHIFGAAASFEIVNGTSPTVDAAGEIAIDTNTDNSNITHGSIIFYDGTGLRYVPSVSTLPSTDNDVLVYDSASNSFLFEAQSGGGSLDAAYNDSTATITVDAYDILFDLNDSTNDYGLVIDNNTSGVIAIGLEFTSGGGGVLTTAIEASNSLITNALSIGPNTILGTTAVINFNNFDVAGSGQITLSPSSALTTAIDVTDTDITNAIDIGTNILAISTGTIGSNAATIIDFLDFDVSADGLIILAPDGGGDAITVTPSAAITDGLDVSNSIITNAINVGPNTIVGTTAVIDFTNFDVSSGGTTTTKSLVANVVALPGGNILVGHTVNSNYLNVNGGFGTGGLERITSTGNLTNISAITAGHLALSIAGDSFTRGTDVTVGAGPKGVATADFNGDGYPDLAVANITDNDVSILLNDGDGTFTKNASDQAVGAGPQTIAAADFNADGYPDLAVTNASDADVSILLNDGDGTFTRNASDEAVGTSPRGITTADFNADGYPDLAVVNNADNDVSIHLNDGDGTFTRNGTDEAVGAGPQRLTTADFNADGYPDLAVVNQTDNDVSILLNDGDGTFTRNGTDEATGTDPFGITTADFNADGYPDLAVTNFTDNDVSILLNDGDGTFTKNASDEAVGTDPFGIIAADFNADGYPDLAVVNSGNNDVSILLNDRDGTFTKNASDEAAGSSPQSITSADFDQDGYIDFVVVNQGNNDVSIHLNDTQTTFTGRLLDLTSNSSNTSQRTLVQLTNDNTGATGTTALTIQQDGGGTAILVTGASILHALDASDSIITNALNVGSNTITGTTAVIDFTNFDVSAAGQVTIGSFGGATATTVCENSGLLSACSSSIRYKEEVLDLTAGLDIIQQLRPVSFNWIGREEPDLGFIAEEVAAIYPLLITYVDEQIEGVKYGQLSALLVNAINEQQAEIIALADLVGVDLSALTIENSETEEVMAESLLSRVDSLGARLTSLEEQGLVAGETTDNDAAGSDESLPYPQGFVATQPYPQGFVATQPYPQGFVATQPYPQGFVAAQPYPQGFVATQPYPQGFVATQPYPQGFVATQPTTPDDLPSNEIFWQDIAITGLLTVENNADILGELTVRSDVTLYADLIVDTINIANALFVHGDTTLFGNLLIEGDVEVTGALSRSNEQVGEVTIPEGQQWAQISFNQSFLGVPTVNVTSDDSTVSYTVSDVTAAGFTVTLTGKEPGKDTQFSWHALVAPEDGSTVEYGGEFETDEVPTDDSEETNTTAESESTPEAGSDDVVQVDIEDIITEDIPGLEIILGG